MMFSVLSGEGGDDHVFSHHCDTSVLEQVKFLWKREKYELQPDTNGLHKRIYCMKCSQKVSIKLALFTVWVCFSIIYKAIHQS